MSKTVKIIIALVIVLILIGVGVFFFLPKGDVTPETGTGPTFGEGGDREGGRIIETTTDRGGDLLSGLTGVSAQRLYQIHESAVAGAGVFQHTEEDGGDIFVRYIERGVGHIYETNMTTLEKIKLSNETRLKIHEAFWGNEGNSVLIRYIDERNNAIRSFLISLGETKDIDGLLSSSGSFYPENIQSVAISPQSANSIFYTLTIENTAIGTIQKIEGGARAQIFSSPLTEWRTTWPNKDTITLTTKASGIAKGISYNLNTKTEELTRTLGGISGLTTLLSPDGTKILYSEADETSIALYVYNMETREQTPVPFATLSEKCVWAHDSENVYCGVPKEIPSIMHPDNWYQGLISFSDDLWEFNTETFITKSLLSFSVEARDELDSIELSLDTNDTILFFQNKNDLTLWALYLQRAPTINN